ncbi:MAG TPA: CAP domain-containing protein [Albitalea sp.]|uniref:CAP domain-containing protein n=1 Tax=Piscinibacter sp. TaxID=1903157 RepID=UPI002ED1A69B
MLWARMRRAAVVAMWGGLLAACGGGGSEAPAPAPAPMPSGSTDCGLADFQASLMARVNQVRAAGATCGSKGAFPATGALAWNNLLTQAAAGHSQDMAAKNYFSHTSQDGRTFTQRIDATGYAWMNAGENIAAGQRTVDSVMNGWMNSPDHCENIMSNAFTEIGVACVPGTASNTYATYWTMDLGKPR